MNVLYFWASTLQNKAQTPIKTRVIWVLGIYIWIIKVSMAILTLEYESLLAPRQAASAAGNVWTAFNAWHGWPWRGHWQSPSWIVPWCKAPIFFDQGKVDLWFMDGCFLLLSLLLLLLLLLLSVLVFFLGLIFLMWILGQSFLFFPLFGNVGILASSNEHDETHWRSILK